MINQEHLTMEGLAKIVNIKASMNLGTIPEGIVSLLPANESIMRKLDL